MKDRNSLIYSHLRQKKACLENFSKSDLIAEIHARRAFEERLYAIAVERGRYLSEYIQLRHQYFLVFELLRHYQREQNLHNSFPSQV